MTTSNHKLRLEDVAAIRDLYKKGWRQVDLAVKFGISQSHVSEIVNGRKWKTSTSTTKPHGRLKDSALFRDLHPLLRDLLQALKQEES